MQARPTNQCPRNCCWTPFGICHTGHSCQHHKDARAAIDMWEIEQAANDRLRYRSDATKVRVVR